MRKFLFSLWIFLASLCPAPAQMMQDIVNAQAPVVASYSGPGDVVSGATAWYGLRAYNAAYASPGTGKSVNLRRASDNATCDFVIATSGALGGTAAACAQGGGLSLATFATQDATASCTIATTTATCTGASSTPHVGSTITGAGVTQPCYASAVGTFTGGAGTVTLAGNGAASPCGTIGGATTMTFTYGLFVTTAYDQSGANACTSAACNLTQATAGSQPQLLPNCVNALPCMSSNSSSIIMSSPSRAWSVQPNSFTSVAVRNTNTASFNQIININASDDLIYGPTANLAGVFCGSTLTAAATDGTWHSLQATCNTTSSVINIDGTATTGSGGASNPGSGNAHFSAASAQFLGGFAGEIGVWENLAFTTPNQTNLCHNERLYWGTGGSC